MGITPQNSPPNDVEAPSYGQYGGEPQKAMRDPEFEDDVENTQHRKRQAKGRCSAIILGMMTLAAAAFAIYFFLAKDGRLEGGSPVGSALRSNPGGNSNPGSPGTQISLATMAAHSVPEDCWVAYYGQVYDMTQYAPTHPASPTLITSHCGKDATAAYAGAHSRSLLSTVNRYLLGALEGADPSQFPPDTGMGSDSDSSED